MPGNTSSQEKVDGEVITTTSLKMSYAVDTHPPRKILVVVTVGGSTNSAPMLEICAILSSRGHTIEFATLEGRENLVALYPFVSTIHIIGRPLTQSYLDEFYSLMQVWDNVSGKKKIIQMKRMNEEFWVETYDGLQEVVRKTNPDVIFADYQVEAARDVAPANCLPLVMLWPQMPWMLAPQSWIPGQPGTQTRCLTSEHASLWDRIYDHSYLFRWSPYLVPLQLWMQKTRQAAGVKTKLPLKKKPDYLLLINSFFGLEPAKDLPPLMQVVGPVLANEYSPLSPQEQGFLGGKRAVVYVAFGTHLIPPPPLAEKILLGLNEAISIGLIDGVIWSLQHVAKVKYNMQAKWTADGLENLTWADLIDNMHSSWLFLDFAAQRAILNHSSTVLYLTHAGPSSANEALYHGVPLISCPIAGDQIQESMRLVAAGVALPLDKFTCTAENIQNHVATILSDRKGEFRRNVLRMQRIAHIAVRRKALAADLIEEYVYDWGLRFEHDVSDLLVGERPSTDTPSNSGRGKELSPMHLQTADARMSWFKAHNVDLWLIFIVPLVVLLAVFIVLGVELGKKR
ncbi:hypothetical protein MferCBS31731_002606 [Microsporum ferrugineum]